MPSKNIEEYLKQKLEAEKNQSSVYGVYQDNTLVKPSNTSEKYQNENHKKWVEQMKAKGILTNLEGGYIKTSGSVEPVQKTTVLQTNLKGGNVFHVVTLAREFYTVEALRFLYEGNATTSQAEALDDYRSRLHTSMAYLFRDYILLSCFGEARHGGICSKDYIPEMVVRNRFVRYRANAGELAKEFAVESIRDKVYKLFADGNWQSSFGGERWAKAIKALDMFSRPMLFIDHVFDLKHNGSSLFNKIDYGLLVIEDTAALKEYLNKRFAVTIESLKELVGEYLRHPVSEELLPLIKVVHSTQKRTLFSMQPLLNYKPIEFGSKVLSEPVEIESKPVGCTGCGYHYFRVSEGEHFCSECLGTEAAQEHVGPEGWCSDCKEAHKIYYGTPNKKQKTKGKKEKKSESRYKKGTGLQIPASKEVKQETIKIITGTGGKSSGGKSGKPKFSIGSQDYTNILAIKPAKTTVS